MGANWVRADRSTGTIELAGLADGTYEGLHLVCDHDMVYDLTPTDETRLEEDTVSGVHLDVYTAQRGEDLADLLILAPAIAYRGLRNWLMEQRHFTTDEPASVRATTLTRGERIEVNGRYSSRVVRGWVKESGSQRWLPNF